MAPRTTTLPVPAVARRVARPIACLIVTMMGAALAGGGCGGAAGNGRDGAVDVIHFDVPPLLDANGAGYALSFDGINDYATAGNAGFAAAGAEQSVSLWVNYTSSTANQDFLVMRVDFAAGVRIGIRAGTITVSRVYVDRPLVAAPTLPSAGAWHHVAYTFDRTTHILYIDGVMVASSTAASDSRTPNQVWLGTLDGTAELYTGLMDEVRVWSVVRSAADVQKDMLHRMPGTEPGLVAYWTFDDSQNGGRCADMSHPVGSDVNNDMTLGDGIAERMPSRVLSDAPVVAPARLE